MKIEELQKDATYYMVLDSENEPHFLTTSELDRWVADGSLEQGDLVVTVTINEIREAKSKVYLPD